MGQILYTRVPTVIILIFIIKHKLVWLMMSSMLSLFSFWDLDKSDSEILDFWLYYRIAYFGVYLDLGFQICINSCTLVFSDSNLSLIEFMASRYGTKFSTCWR